MLNAEIASNILRHIFKAPDCFTLTPSGSNVKTDSVNVLSDYIQGKTGDRYLALFTEMPRHEVDGGNYVIRAGKEPWGKWENESTSWNNEEAKKSTTGYLRNKLSNVPSDRANAMSITLTKNSSNSEMSNPRVTASFKNEAGNTGISGGPIMSEPIISNGSDYDAGYGRKLEFDVGSAFIYNSDMIFFPESTEPWGKIVGFGIFNDSGKNEDGTTKKQTDDYYTEHLLFWGNLTPTDDSSDGSVNINKSEIAIFRNNDFQVTINHNES